MPSNQQLEESQMEVGGQTPEELCVEARRLRGVIASAAEQLHHLYSLLYHQARRSKATETTYAYINVANSGRRLAGAVLQGIRRASAFDRALEVARQETQDRESREEKASREAARGKRDLSGSKGATIRQMLQDTQDDAALSNDLDSLFGQEEG